MNKNRRVRIKEQEEQAQLYECLTLKNFTAFYSHEPCLFQLMMKISCSQLLICESLNRLYRNPRVCAHKLRKREQHAPTAPVQTTFPIRTSPETSENLRRFSVSHHSSTGQQHALPATCAFSHTRIAFLQTSMFSLITGKSL